MFELRHNGTLTTLHSFAGDDGELPEAGLIQATDGKLYGTTSNGGANGDGTVFSISQTGTLTTLHSFDGADGTTPTGALIQASNGNLYGTTYLGGANDDGTVFEITPGGALTTLYNFCSEANCTDGSTPFAGLVQASDGNLYGTTTADKEGGTQGLGTVFQITLDGVLTTLYSFEGADGEGPSAALIQVLNGNLYGTSESGGANEDGTVFTVSLPPPSAQ